MIKTLLYTIVITILCLLVLLAGAVFISVDDSASVPAPLPLTDQDVARIRQLASENSPAKVVSAAKVQLQITDSELNDLLRFANQFLENKLRASVNLKKGIIYSDLSYRLPSNPLGKFINIKLTMSVGYARYFVIDEMSIGHLSVPSVVLHYLQPAIADYIKEHYPSYYLLWKLVKRIDVADSAMTVHYQIKRIDYSKLRSVIKKVAVDDVQRERISAYALEMDRILSELDTKEQSVINVVAPIFTFAQKRSLINEQAVEENRIALLTLAAYTINKNPLSYVSDETLSVRPRIELTLKDRGDLTKHYLISSAINMMSDSVWSNAIGLRKELKDANGGSGFSFVDLMADIAGNKLATLAQSPARAVEIQSRLSQLSSEDEIMADISGLQEGLTAEEFRIEYGNLSSEEYIQVIRDIERRLFACSVYRH
ncbi:MAG: hypothetical protein OEY29_04420 [Gammaproteobacteria bacterium]|nr:hypothetical protein [Gammaproteobacteria bacterium]